MRFVFYKAVHKAFGIEQTASSNIFLPDKVTFKLDGSLPANPVNDQRVANAVTLNITFRLP